MSARLREEALRRLPMTLGRLDEVLVIEQAAYEFPWTRGNFIDSLAARYLAETLMSDSGVVGYFVAMGGIDEMHLLNLTVAPAWQGRGHGRALLDALVDHCRARGERTLWLEVRESNTAALQLYGRLGFSVSARRPGYYTNPSEDALILWREEW